MSPPAYDRSQTPAERLAEAARALDISLYREDVHVLSCLAAVAAAGQDGLTRGELVQALGRPEPELGPRLSGLEQLGMVAEQRTPSFLPGLSERMEDSVRWQLTRSGRDILVLLGGPAAPGERLRPSALAE